MSWLRVNKQRPPTKTGAIPLARRWAFTLRLLIPFPGLGSFSRSYVRSCRRSSAAGLAVQAGDHRITIWSELAPLSSLPCHRSLPDVRTVRFESSNRCPPSLEPPALKLSFVPEDGRELIFQLSTAGCNILVKITRCLILGYITSDNFHRIAQFQLRSKSKFNL